MDGYRGHRERGRPPHPDTLTPAEWRVLEQVRAGRSNTEIADVLGVSVNTVRYHVSSMLAKLELRHRHELAAWRGEPAESSRAALGRFTLAAPFAWLRDTVTSSAVGKTALVASIAAISVGTIVALQAASERGDGGVAPPATPTAEATPSAPAVAPPEPTPEPTPATPEPTPSPEGTPADEPEWLLPFDGITAEIGDVVAPSSVATPGEPQSPFPSYDRGGGDTPSMLIYDFATGEVEDHGPGAIAQFTDDGQYAVWTRTDAQAGWLFGVVTALNLESGDIHDLADGRVFPSDTTAPLLPGEVLVQQENNDWSAVEIETGSSRALDAADVVAGQVSLPGGLVIEYRQPAEIPGVNAGRHVLFEAGGGTTLIEFDATVAVFADDREFVLVTPPSEDDGRWWANLAIVDIDRGTAEFLTAAEVLQHVPVAAGERFVAWNERYCDHQSDEPRALRVYDRDTGEVTDIESDLTVVEINGTDLGLSYSGFGVDAWLDLETMQWREVMPEGSIHASWSPDRQYASLGAFGGHGGMCG